MQECLAIQRFLQIQLKPTLEQVAIVSLSLLIQMDII